MRSEIIVAFVALSWSLAGCGPERDCDGDLDGWDSIRCGGEDCNDATYLANPDAPEICDGMDNDCDGFVDGPTAQNKPTWFLDADGDGYGDPAETLASCTALDGYVNNGLDCDDGRTLVGPGATEVCDGLDQDCDGQIDEGAPLAPSWFPDGDGDGFGRQGSTPVTVCQAPDGHVDNDADCDDSEPEVHPGAEDPCDGRDSDCDGIVEFPWYRDFDGDGHGDATFVMDACEPAAGFVAGDDDCDDDNPDVHPGHPEVCGDGVENDCDGAASECGLAGDLLVPEDATTTIAGDSGGLHFGAALATGDLDGDGLPDLAASAPQLGSEDEGGAVYLFAGPPAGAAMASDADGLVDGAGAGWGFGATMASGHDVDGDGFDDLLVAAPGYDPAIGEVGAGFVALFPGPLEGDLELADALATGAGEAGSGYGFGAALVPDLDGDGLADVAISAPWALGGLGEVRVFSGAGLASLEPADADAVLVGGAGAFGWSLSGPGDLDGDGLGDLVVGAPESGGGSGQVYAFRSPSGTVDVASAWGTLSGDAAVAFAGTSLDGGGDPDGDGRAAVLVGGQRVDGDDAWSAAAWLVDLEAGEQDLSSATVQLVGGSVPAPAPEQLPLSVRSAGDVDGDGAPDVAIVWLSDDGPAGAVWTSPWTQPQLDLDGADATLSGLVSFSGVRSPLAALGDLDGDGYGDLAVGSWGSSAAASQGGAVFVLMGGPGL